MSVNVKSEVITSEGGESDREALLSKKNKLEQRLEEINGPANKLIKNEWKMVKTEVHWDSLLQELVRVSSFLVISHAAFLDLVSE